MSYCRFGDNDAYTYMTYEGFCCSGCLLAEQTELETPYTDILGFTHRYEYEPVEPFTTARAILNHVAQHRLAGHEISTDVDVRIMSEYPDQDVSVVESDEEREKRIAESAPLRDKLREAMREAYNEGL